MPTYPFRCQKCGNRFDLFLLLSERDGPQKCPRCGSRKTKREIAAGVVGRSAGTSPPPGCSAGG